MAFETRNLNGALFRNERKEKDTQPDYTGNCKIDNVEYWVSGWVKTPRNGGKKFMSLAFDPKNASPVGAVDFGGFDDDIPF